ncbi:MAG: energy-dependent translational throttle protein EttA, partial [Gammaproteobacteria bacterium]|nr:energy-dependent translational throttle protein EttA [Gammaproteobacteria bacterium]
MPQFVYTMQGVGKIVPPGREILSGISLSFFPGAKIGVLGLNGAGKSTLLAIMAGLDLEHEGEARAQKGIRVGFLPQEPRLDEGLDVRGNVSRALASVTELLTEYDAIAEKFAEPLDDDEMTRLIERQGELTDRIEAVDGWNTGHAMEIAADALRLPPWDANVATLSGGERRRVALCELLLGKPDMLLLDEPTNHLDADSVAWLERFLGEYPGTVVAVTHDRYFLDNVAGWILELDRGRGIPFEGNYTAWLTARDARLAVERQTERARQRAVRAELEWVRSSPRGRQARGRARLARFEELNSKEVQERGETAEIYIPPGPRLGDKVIEVQGVAKAYGDRVLMEDVSFAIPAGPIVGVVGGNGAGKSTLLRILDGREAPDSGTVELGDTVKTASVDQSRDVLDDAKTVWQEISDGQDILRVGSYEFPSRAYVGRFNFRGPDQQKFVGQLSGGER